MLEKEQLIIITIIGLKTVAANDKLYKINSDDTYATGSNVGQTAEKKHIYLDESS